MGDKLYDFSNCNVYVDDKYIGQAEIKETKLASDMTETKNFNGEITGSMQLNISKKLKRLLLKTYNVFIGSDKAIRKRMKYEKRIYNSKKLYEKRKASGRKF